MNDEGKEGGKKAGNKLAPELVAKVGRKRASDREQETCERAIE